jgi:hypothetical protein
MRPKASIEHARQELIDVLSALDETEWRRASEGAKIAKMSLGNFQRGLFRLGERAVESRLTSQSIRKNGQMVYEWRRKIGALDLFALRGPGVAARRTQSGNRAVGS